jgi:hypothetical protein
MPYPRLYTLSNGFDYLELPTLAVLCIAATETCASLDAGKRLAQRVKTHSAQAECLGVKVLEAEGASGSCPGIRPGLQPDPLAQLVGRGLTGQAEERRSSERSCRSSQLEWARRSSQAILAQHGSRAAARATYSAAMSSIEGIPET